MKLIRPKLVGSLHNELCHKMTNVFKIQKEDEISNGIKGFILSIIIAFLTSTFVFSIGVLISNSVLKAKSVG